VIKRKKIIIISSFILLGGLFFYFSSLKKEEEEEEKEPELLIVQKEEKEEIKENYVVDIKGAIIKPQVYEIEVGKRVIDVINKAGGLTKEADTSVINLSKKVIDEMVIIIYTKKEIEDFKKKLKEPTLIEVIKYIEKNDCPDPLINDACLNNSSDDVLKENKGLVSLNEASLGELLTLTGIGEVKALAIIDYREENGPFKSIEELMEVKGIGESIFAKIKDYITI
jgi:competence protein ComEA